MELIYSNNRAKIEFQKFWNQFSSALDPESLPKSIRHKINTACYTFLTAFTAESQCVLTIDLYLGIPALLFEISGERVTIQLDCLEGLSDGELQVCLLRSDLCLSYFIRLSERIVEHQT